MPYSETHLFSDREEFKPEIIAGKGVGEQRLTLHRKNCRLYYMYLPTETREMVYVENFFETHWLEKARFGRRNVPWPSVEFVRSGSLLVESPDLPHPQHVPAGSLLWIPPVRETLLRPGPEGFCCKVSLTLGGILLPDWQAKSGFDQYRVLPQIDRKRFELLVEDFRRLSEQQSEEALHRNGLTTWKLLQFLQNPFPLREVPERFRKSLEKLRQNLARPVTLEELAKEACCSRIHLARAFRNYFGETPHRMLRNLRMRLAANLLLNNPDLSIKEIAAQVGYDNALTFSAEFKRDHGESPRNFRNRQNWN
jgi:transcriptional regulator, araC family